MPKKEEDSLLSWKLVYEQFKPAQERLREALCTLGNGYFATRGAAHDCAASRLNYPGTYIAGVYNKTPTRIAGRTIYNEDLVNCPNWLYLTFRMGTGEWTSPFSNKILSFRQELDMRRGALSQKISFVDRKERRTTVETERIVHMSDPHRAAVRYAITPENYEGWIVLRSCLDGSVQNTGVARYRQLNTKHLKTSSLGRTGANGVYLSVKTSRSQIEIAEAEAIRIFSRGKEMYPASRIIAKEKKCIAQEFGFFVRKKQKYEVEKIVSLYTSRDAGIRNPLAAAIRSIKNPRRYNDLFKTHRAAWNALWKECDITIDGDPFAQQVLRLHTFHLLQTASIHTAKLDVSIPARGLHGEAYRGHIFWDELFAMPFFDLHEPDIVKALLLYRYRRLAQARKYAKEGGYKGAMFPWQSGSTGEEETQVIHLNPLSGRWGADHSHCQRHISFAIAYNAWQHWKRTGDLDFLTRYGAELIVSIARFGASLARFSRKDGRYHITGVMGPDEFHEKFPGSAKSGLKDNAYTNLLVVWTILRAQEALAVLPQSRRQRLIKKLGLHSKDFQKWNTITRKMNVIFNADGIISQFGGYFKLEELNWRAYRAKYGNIERLDRILKAEGKSPNAYKAAKQADVLMLFYLLTQTEIRALLQRLGYRFEKQLLKKNYEYYIKRTSHGSTLSKVVHCYAAYLLGKRKESWHWFREVLKSDIYDTQGGTTAEGIHVGVMGGSLSIAVMGFIGLRIAEDRIKIAPNLPKKWRSVSFNFHFKKRHLFLRITQKEFSVFIRGPKAKMFPVPVLINGKQHSFRFGKTYRISLTTPPESRACRGR